MQTQIADRWLRDMPQQFLGKHNIEVLVKAFARQLQELQEVFDDLNTKAGLETASWQNLDYVGTIIPLTRKEAGELAGIGATEPVISDERYRRLMKYKILKNTSECTYDDLVAGIELLWGYRNIHYKEDPEHPAMILFETPVLSLDEEDPVEFHPGLCIRASGVGVRLRKTYGDVFRVQARHASMITFVSSFYPQFNLPELRLDNTWELDGGKTLGGYDADGKVDLYPVDVVFKIMAKGGLESNAAVGFLAKTEGRITSRQGIGLQARAVCRTETEESVDIQAAVKVRAGGGEILVDNQRFLDGAWELDGGKELNGGVDVW